MGELLLDVSRLIWRTSTGRMPTGIDRICLAYMDHYGPHAQAVVQKNGVRRILSPDISVEMFTAIREGGSNFKKRVAMLLTRSLLQNRSIQEGDARFYLNVGHTGLDTPGLKSWASLNRVRPILLLADLIPITHAEFCRPGEREKHIARVTNLLAASAGVIGISEDTINQLTRFGNAAGLAMPPLLAAHIGVDVPHLPQMGESIPFDGHPYFVILGTIEGRKNHLLLLNIWKMLVDRLGPAAPKLVVIGQRGWECEQVVDMLERSMELRDHVVELSALPDHAVGNYLRNARALLFPSFVEGYGMPLVEALAVGTPVVASDLSVFRELAGDIPDYISPIDGIGWMRAIEELAAPDSRKRAAQIHRMRGYRYSDWTSHFTAVDAWIATLDADVEAT